MTPIGALGFLPEGEPAATIVPCSNLSSTTSWLASYSTHFLPLDCTFKQAMVSSSLDETDTPENRTPSGVPLPLSAESTTSKLPLVGLVGVVLRAIAAEGEDDEPGSPFSSRERSLGFPSVIDIGGES